MTPNTNGERNGTPSWRWLVGVLLTITMALTALAWSSLDSKVEATAKDVKDAALQAQHTDARVDVMDARWAEVLRRLESIEDKVDSKR